MSLIKERNDNLTKEQELELGRLIQARNVAQIMIEEDPSRPDKEELLEVITKGDEAHETLFLNHVNLARKIAHTLHRRTASRVPIEDVIQDALIGLSEATYKYDPSKNCKLTTHAYYGISKRVSVELNKGRFVRMPENQHGVLVKINKAKREYIEEEIEGDEIEFIVERSGVPIGEVNLILSNMQPTVSLNAPIGDDNQGQLLDFVNTEGGLSFGIGDHAAEFESETSANDISNAILKDMLETLDEKELDILAFEYGAFPPSMSYDEFLVSYNMTDRQFTSAARRLIRKLKKVAEEQNQEE